MKRLIAAAMMTMLASPFLLAQEKLTDKEIGEITSIMQKNPYCRTPIMYLESPDALSYFLRRMPLMCFEDIEDVVKEAESWHLNNQKIVRLQAQIYPKPGSKKSEKSLATYFTNTEAAKQTFEKAQQAEEMYALLIKETTPVLEAKRDRTFSVPQGELTYFCFRQSGGMRYRPATQGIVKKQEDGTYIAMLDTEDFDRQDTIPLTQEQVEHVRQLLIDGEVYKMPAISQPPIMIHDAPHTSVSVKFADASFSCDGMPPRNYGGKNIWAVYRYLKELRPKEEAADKQKP